MNIVATATYAIARLAAPHMIRQRSGFIGQISSPGGAFDFYGSADCIARGALDRLAQALSHELGEFGISSVSIWPTYVRTERILRAQQGEAEGISIDGAINLSEDADSPEFVGTTIAHLIADKDHAKLSGKVHTIYHLAKRYGLKDVDGSEPALSAFLKAGLSIVPDVYTSGEEDPVG